MNPSKLLISSIAGLSIIALSAAVSMARPARPFSATGGAHGAGVLILKTHSSDLDNSEVPVQ
jgi:hypothetical protein